MARRALKFRQSEVSRAIKAAQEAGLNVGRLEIEPDGKIVIITGAALHSPDEDKNEWDSVQ